MIKLFFDFSPAYELLASAYLYLHPTNRTDLGSKWTKAVEQQLSNSLREEMKDKRLEVLHRLAILVWQCPDKSSSTAFLDWLESLTVGEMIEHMIPWVNRFQEDMSVVKERILRVLRGWDEEYFSKLDSEILKKLELRHLLEEKRAEQEAPAAQFERITRGMVFDNQEREHTVVLIPQHHLSPHYILDFYEEGLVVCQYPVQDEADDGDGLNSLARLSTALADEYRLKILRLVSKGASTYTDIVKELNLGKSLVSYHIMQLRVVGLLEAHYKNGRLAYYQLRTPEVTGYTSALLRVLNIPT